MVETPSNGNQLPPQKAYQDLLTRWSAPVMKEHGFSRKGPTFYRRERDNWGVVTFQKSTTSTAERVRFTVNLGVTSGRLVEFFSGRSQDTPPSVWVCPWRERVGFLLPERQDTWWTIDATTSRDELGRAVTDLLRSVVIPAVQQHLTDEALRDLWLTGRAPGATDIQRLLCLSVLLKDLGPADRLDDVITELRRKAAGTATAATVEDHLRQLDGLR